MNVLLLCGSALGLLAVVIGALVDHSFALSENALKSVETAIRYNMLYAVLITGLALLNLPRAMCISGYVFTAGTAFFSFGIYGAYLLDISQLIYLTPLGGTILMLGWAMLMFLSFKSKIISSNHP